MKSILTLLSIMVLLTLPGCKLLQVKGEVGGVEVEAKTKDSKADNEGIFCPPGQAKKGNC